MGLKKIPDLTHDTTPSAIAVLETDRGGASFYNILAELLAQANSLLPINLSVVASVASSALTLAVKSAATGNNPSATDPVYIPVRSVTRGLSKIIMVPVTAALSIVVPSGATLGHASGVDSQIILSALNSGSDASPVLELSVTTTYADQSVRFQSSTTISSGATSATTFYSTTGRSTVPMNPIARCVSNQTAAGTWAAVPLQIDVAPFTLPTVAPVAQTLTLLSTLTASNSATLDDTTDITATYDSYMFELRNLVPVTTAVKLLMRTSTDGGATYAATSYLSLIAGAFIAGTGGPGMGASSDTTGIEITDNNVQLDGLSNSANHGVSGQIFLHAPNGTTTRKHVTGSVTYLASGANRMDTVAVGGAWDGANTAINAIRFIMSSGNISSGSIKVYGIKT